MNCNVLENVNPGLNLHLLPSIKRALHDMRLSITVQADANVLYVTFPKPTEESRKQLVRQAEKMFNDAKNKLGHVRDEHDRIRKRLEREGLEELGTDGERVVKKISVDDLRLAQNYLEGRMKEYLSKMETLVRNKQKELLDN